MEGQAPARRVDSVDKEPKTQVVGERMAPGGSFKISVGDGSGK
jgi:hypothetical protein